MPSYAGRFACELFETITSTKRIWFENVFQFQIGSTQQNLVKHLENPDDFHPIRSKNVMSCNPIDILGYNKEAQRIG